MPSGVTSSRGTTWPWILKPPRRRGPTSRASVPGRPGRSHRNTTAPASNSPASNSPARTSRTRTSPASHAAARSRGTLAAVRRAWAARPIPWACPQFPRPARTPSPADQSQGLLWPGQGRRQGPEQRPDQGPDQRPDQGPDQVRDRETDRYRNDRDRDRTGMNQLQAQREGRAADRARTGPGSSVMPPRPLRGPRPRTTKATRRSITSRRHRHRCRTSIRWPRAPGPLCSADPLTCWWPPSQAGSCRAGRRSRPWPPSWAVSRRSCFAWATGQVGRTIRTTARSCSQAAQRLAAGPLSRSGPGSPHRSGRRQRRVRPA